MKYFTKAQIEEIRKQLATLGVRDTDLPYAHEMTGDELIAIVQDSINKKTSIKDFFLEFLPDDFAERLVQGESAYEIARRHGYQGTEAEWLDSLHGAAGATGATGPQGPQGPVGPQGPQGPQGPAGSGADVIWNQINTTGEKIATIKIGNASPIEVKAPTGGSDTMRVATSSDVGGIKLGYQQNGRNFPVELSPNTYRAFVYVPGGSSDPGSSSGYYEQIFRATAYNASTPSLPNNGDAVDDEVGPWKHFVDDEEAVSSFGQNYDVWMASRWISASGVPGTWKGPWNLSGNPGADGTDIEFIYTRTADESVPEPARPLATDTKASGSPASTFQDNDWYPSGWTDNPQGVEATMRLEWMSFRMKTGGVGGVGGTWQDFSTPVVWSAYGRQGLDGDGIEYIFATGSTAPTGNADPAQWFSDAGYQTTREYIRSDYAGIWHDNPVNINSAAAGTIQWVSVRKKYADTTAHATYGLNPYWHTYTSPTFWNNKAADGVASGVVVDLAPDMFQVPCDASTGVISANFNGTTHVSVKYAGQDVADAAITTANITVKDTKNPATNYTSQNWVSVSGLDVTVAIPSSSAIDFGSAQLLVRIPITGTVNGNSVSAEAVLTIVGHALGTNGVSYSLNTSSNNIRKRDGVSSPAAIDVSVIKNDGLNNFTTYTAVAATGTTVLPSPFSLVYIVDQGVATNPQEVNMATANINSIPTNGVTDNIIVRLKYNSLVIIQEQIHVFNEPTTPETQGILSSIVFKRSASAPSQPGTGTTKSGSSTADSNGITNANYGGAYPTTSNGHLPIPYGWSDGVPAYDSSASAVDNTLWMTTRIFTSDGESPQQSSWSPVAKAMDTEDFDFEFAYQQTNDSRPATPITGNRHNVSYPYGYSGQVWYDPVDDNEDEAGHARDFSVMYWMAMRAKHGNVADAWTIVRIKGETGDQGIAGKDAIPLRIRNWSELYQATHSGQYITPLTGTNKIFSGYEEWQEGGQTVHAPFRDVIIVTPQDYPSGYPFTTPSGGATVDTPALLVVNYDSDYPTGYTSVGVFNTSNPSANITEDLKLPYGASDANNRNWTSGLYQDKSSSQQACEDYGFQWSVFTNLGAIYAQILVATQGYIGRLTVNHLSTGDALVGTDIYSGVFEVKKNGVVRARFGVDDAGDIVLQFLDATGTTVLYEFGPTGITSHVSNKAPSYTAIALAGMNTDVSLTPDSSDGNTWIYPTSSDFVNYYIFQDGEVTVGGLTTYYVSDQSEQLSTHSQYHGKIFTTGTGSPEGKTTIANGTYLAHPALYSSALIDATSNKKIAYDKRTGPVVNPPIGWWFFITGLRTYADGQFQNEGTKFLFRRIENGQEVSRGTSEPFGLSVLTRVHDITNIDNEATTYPY